MTHDPVLELYYGGAWNTAPARAGAGVNVSRGASAEGQDSPPSTADATLDNRTGAYNPRNPTSALYGVAGRNTPMRLRINSAQSAITDTFTRSVTAGWGSTTTGEAWSIGGNGGTVANSDHDVTGSVGTHEVPTTDAFRRGFLQTVNVSDVDVYAECVVAAPTGGELEPTLVLRGRGTTTSYLFRVRILVGNTVRALIWSQVDGVFAEIAAVTTGLTHSGATTLKIRARATGALLQMKVWQGSSEPSAWSVEGVSSDILGPGFVGLRSGVAIGNTNVKPVVFSWDNLAVTPLNIRSCTEAASWAPQRSPDGGDAWTPVEGGGILRRLGQGESPLKSAATRALTSPVNDTTRIGYWPVEEESGATKIMTPYTEQATPWIINPVQFGGDTESLSSARLAVLGDGGVVSFHPPVYTATGETRVTGLFRIPAGGVNDGTIIQRIWVTGGSLTHIDVVFNTGHIMRLQFRSVDTLVDTVGPFNWASRIGDGEEFFQAIALTQDGSDIDVEWLIVRADDVTAGQATDTVTGQSVGRVTRIQIGDGNAVDVAFGQVGLGNDVDAFDNYVLRTNGARGTSGYLGETAGDRFVRLCEEEGIPACVVGDPDDTQPMGAQTASPLGDLLRECVATDDGMLFELRSELRLALRTGRSRYNQTAALELDYDGHCIGIPLAPVLDDRYTRNDVTANKPGGSSYRAEKTTGPLNVADPSDDPEGVGRYETSIDVSPETDDGLKDQAYWRLHLGTVDESRYPQVIVDLDAAPQLAAQVDEVEIGDLITITNLPTDWQQGPANLLVLGIQESYPSGKFRRVVTFTCAPASPCEIGIVGADDGSTDLRGQAIDTDLSSLNSGINSSTTSLSVASTGGVLWTTDSDDWSTGLNGSGDFGAGLFITVGGEVMRVTNITGASSPQTFTVVRSVNGVVKSHLAGAAVHVTHPVRVGL